jgi:hypothetical protein
VWTLAFGHHEVDKSRPETGGSAPRNDAPAGENRLPEQPGQRVPTILAIACVGQNITRHLGQTECVVEFAISPLRPGQR